MLIASAGFVLMMVRIERMPIEEIAQSMPGWQFANPLKPGLLVEVMGGRHRRAGVQAYGGGAIVPGALYTSVDQGSAEPPAAMTGCDGEQENGRPGRWDRGA